MAGHEVVDEDAEAASLLGSEVADDGREIVDALEVFDDDALDAQVVTEAAPVDPFEGPFAHLVVDEAQDFADDAVWVTQHHVRVGRDAHVRHFAVQLGGELVRMTPRVQFDAPGGNAELFGLYFADDGQHLACGDVELHVDAASLDDRAYRETARHCRPSASKGP